ncbi:MAG: DUF2062 domain-containing protein [Alphaproteobacteria bacterium]|nr:DUF2062 domain-containing protein [Alphaproteobacteria bacterium]
MMFKRATPLPLWRKILNFIYPQIGFRRAGRYIYLRVLRLKGETESIARGVALGVAVSMTPFIGFHLILVGLLGLLIRGNVIAGALSSLVGNPITFPFIWYVMYLVGVMLVPQVGHVDLSPVSLFQMFEHFVTAVWSLDQTLFMEKVWRIWFPMLIGSIPLFILSYVIVYGLAIKSLKKYKGEK